MTRRIVQIAADQEGTDVLCDDGSLWRLSSDDRWVSRPDIPQGPAESPDPIAELEAMGGKIVGDLDGGAQWAIAERHIWKREGISQPYALGIPAAAARLLERVRGGGE